MAANGQPVAAACRGERPDRSGRAPTLPARTPPELDCGRSRAADRPAPRSPAASPAARPPIAIVVTPHDIEGRAAGLIRENRQSLYQRGGRPLYRACDRPSPRRRICRDMPWQGDPLFAGSRQPGGRQDRVRAGRTRRLGAPWSRGLGQPRDRDGPGHHQAPLGGAASDDPWAVTVAAGAAAHRPAAAFSSAAFSVRSQVKSGSSRPKWP
jgi:hypothetical protein